MKKMRVALYCRVAHDDSFSLEAQAAMLQHYATQAGYTIVSVSAEHGNGLTLDRPALKKVTQAVLAGEVDLILVQSITRIGREWCMTQGYIDMLTRHNVTLLCVREQIMFGPGGTALVPKQ